MHYENDNILVSRIDYNAKHIDRNIYKSKANIIFSKIIKNGLLYLGEAELLDGQLRSVLKRINLQGSDVSFFDEFVF